MNLRKNFSTRKLMATILAFAMIFSSGAFMLSVSADNGVTLETTLVDGATQKGSKKTFDVFAKNNGAKISSTVTLNGVDVPINWNDEVKTSYTLLFSQEGENTVVVSAGAAPNTVTKTYTINYVKSLPGEVIGHATWTIEGLTIGMGYIVEPTVLPILEGETSAQALDRFFTEMGFSYNRTGSLTSSFYLSSVADGGKQKYGYQGGSNSKKIGAPKEASVPDYLMPYLEENWFDVYEIDDEGSLGEFDYTYGSGWMYTNNNVFPNVGFADCFPADGDVIRVHFTLAYGSDIGGGYALGGADYTGFFPVANKDRLIDLVGQVNNAPHKSTLLEDASVATAYNAAMAALQELNTAQNIVDTAYANLSAVLGSVFSVSPSKIELNDGSPEQLKAVMGLNSEIDSSEVVWSSSDDETVSVINGVVIGVSEGTATVTAQYDGNVATCLVTVGKMISGINLDKSSITLDKGNSQKLTASLLPADITGSMTITWGTSNGSVAVVDSDGNITAKGAGTATITATIGKYKAECTVTVLSHLTSIRINGATSASKAINNQQQVNVSYTPTDTTDDKTIKWASNKESVATVSDTGLVTAKSVGTATITGTSVISGIAPITFSITVTDYVDTTSISLTASGNINKGSYASLTVSITPTTGSDRLIAWSSDDNSVAKVESTGLNTARVTGMKAGTATITAILIRKNGEPLTKTYAVTVKEIAMTGITLSANTLASNKGDKNTLSVSYLPYNTTDDKTVVWSSSNNDVATVDESGNVTAVGAGTAVITAKVGSFQKTCNIEVRVPMTGIAISDVGADIQKGTSKALSVSYLPADTTGNKTIVWSSSNGAIASVDAEGNVTANAVGTAAITAKVGEYQKICVIRVKSALTGITISETTLSLINGESKTLGAAVLPSDTTDDRTVAWSSSNESVATVDSNGNVRAVGVGNANITAKAGNFEAVCALTVTLAMNSTTTVLDNNDTGISVTAGKDVIPADTTLEVKPITDTNSGYNGLKALLGDESDKFVAFDITLMSGGMEVQPNGKVTVKLPIPEGFDRSMLALYHISGENKLSVEFSIVGNYVVFETESFSTYILANLSAGNQTTTPENQTTTSENQNNNNQDSKAPQTGDNSNITIFIILLFLSAGSLVLAKRRKLKSL